MFILIQSHLSNTPAGCDAVSLFNTLSEAHQAILDTAQKRWTETKAKHPRSKWAKAGLPTDLMMCAVSIGATVYQCEPGGGPGSEIDLPDDEDAAA